MSEFYYAAIGGWLQPLRTLLSMNTSQRGGGRCLSVLVASVIASCATLSAQVRIAVAPAAKDNARGAIVAAAAAGDTCMDFENGNVSAWLPIFVSSISAYNEGGAYGKVLKLVDASGGSIAVNNTEFQGNWLTRYDEDCLCFDYKVDWEQGASPLKAPLIEIYTGSAITTSSQYVAAKRAVFVGADTRDPIQDNSWDRFCLPIGNCSGVQEPPSNDYGHWVIYDNAVELTGQDACDAWQQIITNVTGLILGTDYNSYPSEQVFFDNFCWKCDEQPNPCDVVWGSIRQDTACCRITGIASNASGRILQIRYNVLDNGGVVQSFATAPCLPSLTVPADLMGTTSGTLNFGGCAEPMSFTIDATSTTSSGRVCIELSALVQLEAGGSVRCIDTICIDCRPAPKMRCDRLRVEPYPYEPLNQSWRRFTVFNQKIPESPIKQIRISLSPDPVPGSPTVKWTGGGLQVDPGTVNTWTVNNSWDINSQVEYSVIDLECDPSADAAKLNNSAQVTNWVKFNLGLDYTREWSGTVTVQTIHCDGTDCISTYEWCAKPPEACPPSIHYVDTVRVDIRRPRLSAARLTIPGSADVRVAFATIEPERESGARFFALPARVILPDTLDILQGQRAVSASSVLADGRRGAFAALVEFGNGIPARDTAEVPLVLEWPDGVTPRSLALRVTLYDENARVIRIDSVSTWAVSSVDDNGQANSGGATLFRPEPTPTTGMVRCSYRLSSPGTTDLEIFDVNGRFVAAVDEGEREFGEHSISFDAGGLANGAYVLVLRTPNGILTQPLIVQR